MYLFIPGRHHLLTNFTFQYLFRLVHQEVNGSAVQGIIFAVTSANHAGTRRNPLSFAHRAMMIQDFGRDLGVPVWAFPVEDAGQRDDFAAYTLKSVNHRAQGLFHLTPGNTLVLCSTAVGDLYRKEGYPLRTAEAEQPGNPLAVQPWSVVERISKNPDWTKDSWILDRIHPASFNFYLRYALADLIHTIFTDPLLGDDGDLTGTRDYGSYVRQMDENAAFKWNDTASWIRPGRIGDIGCAVGSWLQNAARDPRFSDSDFYGIEITRALFQICQQRKENREFASPNIWFTQRNAVTGLVFRENSMDTIHTGSLTHEIESYGSHEDLLAFITNRSRELKPGGVWINRDVVGPEDRNATVLLWAEDVSGSLSTGESRSFPGEVTKFWLDSLSTRGRFYRFARDFRSAEGYQLPFQEVLREGEVWFELRMEDAAEFLLTKDYTDNWKSEMHERFCFWSFGEWQQALEAQGFRILPESRTYRNPWVVQNRFEGKVRLQDLRGEDLEWPPTHMVMIAEK